jgi:hypothetical protein
MSITQRREYRFHRHATTGSGDAFQIESDHSEPELEAMNIIRKGQIRWLSKANAVGQIRFVERILGISK